MRREDVKVGMSVTAPNHQSDVRFKDRVGKVMGWTTDKYFIGKGTPIVVRFDNGPEPESKGLRKGSLSMFTSWPRHSDYYFAADELEPQ